MVFHDSPASETQINRAIQSTPCDMLCFDVLYVDSELVESAIKKLKFSNTAGPDGIPPCLLKKCSAEFIPPLLKLFNLSLGNGTFPEKWKSSYMFPIYKKGDKRTLQILFAGNQQTLLFSVLISFSNTILLSISNYFSIC